MTAGLHTRRTRLRRTPAALAALLVAAGLTSAGVLAGAGPAGAADVKKTMTIDGPLTTVANTMAGDNMRVTFTGLVGQTVTVVTSAGTFASNCDAKVSLLRPDGITPLAPAVCGGIAGGITEVPIPSNGNYQVLIDPQGAAIGSVKVNITKVSGTVRSITPGAPAVTTAVPATGTLDFGFLGSTNKFVAYRVSAGTFPGLCNVTATIIKPTGTPLAGSTCVGKGTVFVEPVTQPSGGLYKLRLVSSAAAAGSLKLQLWSAANVSGAITLGSPMTTKLSTPGQQATYTFGATAGQRLTNTWTGSTQAGSYFNVLRPDGSTFASNFFGTGGGFSELDPLDATGTWKFVVDPAQANTGSVTFTLAAVSDITGSITLGTAKTTTFTQAGQRATYTFSATNGQRLTNTWTGSTLAGSYFDLVRPNGTVLTSSYFGTGGGFSEPVALDATGTWKLVIDPVQANIGTVTVTLATVTDITGSITPGGAAVSVTIAQAGQRALLTFAGTSGQVRTAHVTGSTINGGYISLVRPNGTVAQSCFFATGATNCSPLTLNATGTWTLIVDPTVARTGSANVSLT